ncbi:histidinol phosphatase [Aureobasidium pullulans]|uniref:histidinol-phosphatase n=1 Tax=Aureobasidium pullulans TaxID=5580 RepID=A0A4S9SZF0_AURPU|nr:histidinol phosphatase [Aureobasidium pullulans]
MPHSHHSHSGQFCAHATCTLEEMVQQAISLKMDTFALTEHIPRDTADLYPEEVDAQKLVEIFDAYYPEALRLREKYASQITILIGFEGEWIRPSSHTIIKDLLSRYKFDFFVGSIHHTLTKPIDFDHDMYYEARTIAGGSDEDVFAAFFDEQYDMLKALTPPLVGHFDLIRLKSDDPERNWTTMPAVWEKIVRNLDFVASYGGILELNSSAIRKGMSEPYPKAEICKEFVKKGGRFALSDDSHATSQVGLNFSKVLSFVENTGIEEIHYFTPKTDNNPNAQSIQPRKCLLLVNKGKDPLVLPLLFQIDSGGKSVIPYKCYGCDKQPVFRPSALFSHFLEHINEAEDYTERLATEVLEEINAKDLTQKQKTTQSNLLRKQRLDFAGPEKIAQAKLKHEQAAQHEQYSIRTRILICSIHSPRPNSATPLAKNYTLSRCWMQRVFSKSRRPRGPPQYSSPPRSTIFAKIVYDCS